MPLYKGARLKVKRANKHIVDMEVVIDLLKERLLVAAHVNAEGGYEYIKCDFATPADREALDEISVILGDAIHNLKCALDHAWLETVKRLMPSKDWARTKFPSYAFRNELEMALRRMTIDVGAPRLFLLLMDNIKPYDGGDYFIRTVHALDLQDKHRLLIPVVHYSSIGDIVVKNQSGNLVHGSTWGTTDPLPHFVEFARGLHIENPGSASFEVMFQYGNAGRETRAVDSLRFYSQSVLLAVGQLETVN